jgi:hypothetical protein
VQAPQDVFDGARMVILDKVSVDARFILKQLLVVTFIEKTSVIFKNARF